MSGSSQALNDRMISWDLFYYSCMSNILLHMHIHNTENSAGQIISVFFASFDWLHHDRKRVFRQQTDLI